MKIHTGAKATGRSHEAEESKGRRSQAAGMITVGTGTVVRRRVVDLAKLGTSGYT